MYPLFHLIVFELGPSKTQLDFEKCSMINFATLLLKTAIKMFQTFWRVEFSAVWFFFCCCLQNEHEKKNVRKNSLVFGSKNNLKTSQSLCMCVYSLSHVLVLNAWKKRYCNSLVTCL